jgi:hypothetical protein
MNTGTARFKTSAGNMSSLYKHLIDRRAPNHDHAETHTRNIRCGRYPHQPGRSMAMDGNCMGSTDATEGVIAGHGTGAV